MTGTFGDELGGELDGELLVAAADRAGASATALEATAHTAAVGG